MYISFILYIFTFKKTLLTVCLIPLKGSSTGAENFVCVIHCLFPVPRTILDTPQILTEWMKEGMNRIECIYSAVANTNNFNIRGRRNQKNWSCYCSILEGEMRTVFGH